MTLRSSTVTAASVIALLFAGAGPAGAQNLGNAAGTSAPDSALQLRLRTRVMMAPADLSGRVRVTPSADNRMLRVVLDGDNFYRSSDIQLEGDQSPRTHFLAWRSLPPGNYRVVVTAFGTQGPRQQLSQEIVVIGELPRD